MSGFGNVMKGGWHPKGKDGGKESWRGDFKGINQVAGWMGKGKQAGDNEASAHVSRPLASLKDPAAFGPPPKNVNYHGGAALPNEITPHTGGLGAPLSHRELESAAQVAQKLVPEVVEEEEEQRSGPPLPYRADRTGLQTSHLPPPPVHRDVASMTASVPSQPARPKPGLPPRLPSRQDSTGLPAASASSPPPYQPAASPRPTPSPQLNGYLNQSAINRLGNAGVSVPGLGIGSKSPEPNPWKNEQSQPSSPPTQSVKQPATNSLSELQSRFARMNSASSVDATNINPASPPPTTTSPPTQGTTWAEKQAALRTAQSFQKDPSSISMADARTAAGTANNFRERHQDQIATGAQKANAWNKKYNVTTRLNSFLEKEAVKSPAAETSPTVYPTQPQQIPMHSPSPAPELTASISRKPPPPPPPKKPAGMHSNSAAAPPPPVPLGTKPNFS